jgi:hypothetical protein
MALVIAAFVLPRAARSAAFWACSGVAPRAVALRKASERRCSTIASRRCLSLLKKDMILRYPGVSRLKPRAAGWR